MALPHSSTAGANPCPGCLDLRPELYRRLWDPNGYQIDKFPSIKCVDTHYYISSFSRIEEMSKGGCKFCCILDQGMRHFWDLAAIAPSIHDSNSHAADSDEEEDSSSSGNDDEYFYRPCIEIRPRKGLLVSVIHLSDNMVSDDCTKFHYPDVHFGTVRAPLEFYSISGKKTQISLQVLNKSLTEFPGQAEPAPAFGPSVNIPTNLTSDRCKQLLNEWLQECNHHETCQPKLDTGCPKRLIQVSGSLVRLVDAGSQFKENYTTLSHRWGTKDVADKMFKATRCNMKDLQESIHWENLPQTFQDAITITRNVSCNYIWIDSLCIIQDDDGDWKEQASQMSSIYANSYLNIAATASHDGSGGLMFPRFSLNEDRTSSGTTPVHSVELSHGLAVRPDLEHVHCIFFEEEYRRLKKGALSPLLTRAWVFQEQLLPGRTVHFTYSEIVWECRHHTVCECGGLNDWGRHHTNPKKSFNDSITGKAEPHTMFKSWQNFVRAYTALEVTKNEDWPFAIAGIASRLQHKVKSHYLAGLWEADFPAGLLWSASYRTPTEPLKESQYHWNPSEDTPPTWSWLRCIQSLKASGVSSSIFYPLEFPGVDMLVRDSRFGLKLIDATNRPDTEEFLTCFTNVRLRLSGAALKGLARIRSDGVFGQGRELIVRFPEVEKDLRTSADFPLPTILRNSEFEVLCLLLGVCQIHDDEEVSENQFGLVLSDICSKGSFYIRMGEFTFLTPDLFKEAEVIDIDVR